MYLNELFPGQMPLQVTGLSLDSRTVKPGNVFFAIKGTEHDGHWYIPDAVKRGAVCIVHSDPVDVSKYGGGVMPVFLRSTDVRGELGRAADQFYGNPSGSMDVFGVTGTNGKTTTTSIIEWIYGDRKPCGYMGTIGVRFGSMDVLPSLTTPDPVEVHRNLAMMKEQGGEAVAMEVSSHGLVMRRTECVDFDCAVFTNLSWDHLDFHGTMENYLAAKTRLFRNMKPEGVAVLNRDDHPSFRTVRDSCACRYVTYGIDEPADYRAVDLALGHDRTEFVLEHQGRTWPVQTNLLAKYNVYNLLAAIAAMHEMGMSMEDILAKTADIPQVDGRMERIDEGQPFTAIVDYAHTPDGYEKIFRFARELAGENGHVYATFGCPGKRDKAKRPVMGEIAGRYADRIVLTAQDPRDADPAVIAGEIALGVERAGCPYEIETDRKAAIGKALSLAQAGDVVLSLGKGDEPYMYVGDGRDPWEGDNNIVRRLLKERWT